MPDWRQEIRRRLADLKIEPAREAEIIDELSQHLEDYYAELLSGGATEAERRTLEELSESVALEHELLQVERQVINYSVEQRTHEIGVRIALGARRGDIFKLIVGWGMRLAFLGIVIGLAGALALTRIVADLLYQVSPVDMAVYLMVPLLLLVVTLSACYVPARRAAKVDPMIALRSE